MRQTPSDRRQNRRVSLNEARRRYPRVFVDLDWFVTSSGCSTLGRGLELSMRAAWLPIARTGQLDESVLLHVALPRRARLFSARGLAQPSESREGWVIRFTDVAVDDASLLAHTLVDLVGLSALPQLERQFGRLAQLDARFFRPGAESSGDIAQGPK